MNRRTKILAGVGAVVMVIVVFGALAFVTGNVSHLSGHVSNQQTVLSKQQTEIQRALKNQTKNRASNVGTWCHAIDSLQGQLLAYVSGISVEANKRHPGAHYNPTLGLTLKHLDCQALEQTTANSTSKHG